MDNTLTLCCLLGQNPRHDFPLGQGTGIHKQHVGMLSVWLASCGSSGSSGQHGECLTLPFLPFFSTLPVLSWDRTSR